MNTANRVRLAHCEKRVCTRKAPDCRSTVSARWLLKEPPPFRPSLLMKKALRHTAMLLLPHRERCGSARREQPPPLCCAQAGRDSRGASHLRARKSWRGLSAEESANPPMAGVSRRMDAPSRLDQHCRRTECGSRVDPLKTGAPLVQSFFVRVHHLVPSVFVLALLPS